MVLIEWGIKNVSVWKDAVIGWKGKSNKGTGTGSKLTTDVTGGV